MEKDGPSAAPDAATRGCISFVGPVLRVEELSRGTAEVHQLGVGALGRRGEETNLGRAGPGRKALVRADLNQRRAIRKREVEEAAVCNVDHAKTVKARLHFEERMDFAIDQQTVRAELGNPRVFWVS